MGPVHAVYVDHYVTLCGLRADGAGEKRLLIIQNEWGDKRRVSCPGCRDVMWKSRRSDGRT